MRLVYTTLIHFYYFLILIASLFNKKAQLWIRGRKHVFDELTKKLNSDKKVFWIHCASLGEFEQGRPIIENVKKQHPEYFILLTFFSPSGYEIRKNYTDADAVVYLPIDTPGNVNRFLTIVKPSIVCFVKYEYWFNYIYQIHQKNIPIYIASAILRPTQHFFKWYGKWSLKHLKMISYFFAQDQETYNLLKSNSIDKVIITGDTRFDRVAELPHKRQDNEIVQQFVSNGRVLVCGSTWAPDDDVIIEACKKTPALKVIVAPHELSENSLKNIEKKYSELGPVTRYSQANLSTIENAKVVLIDNIGMLSLLYAYAYIGYVGGGFGKGIHNILEVATYGKPIFFGPNYEKFNEAKELIELQGAVSITNPIELEIGLTELLNNANKYATKSKINSHYVLNNKGATTKIIDLIFLS